MSAWTVFVTKYYNNKKKTDPGYMFKQAMSDAAKVYKSSGTMKTSGKTSSKRRKSSRTRRK